MDCKILWTAEALLQQSIFHLPHALNGIFIPPGIRFVYLCYTSCSGVVHPAIREPTRADGYGWTTAQVRCTRS